MGSIVIILAFLLRLESHNPIAPDMLNQDIRTRLFHSHLALLPQMNEIYELELAFSESQFLDDAALVRRGAYFGSVGDQQTYHFRICAGDALHLPDGTTRKRRQFFERNQFRTGYATHGLFPYRGKFHPQMVKGILNAMDMKPGDRVLDPMMGSGTTLVEAVLMGINAVGCDVSPFCRFMAEAKLDGFTVPLAPLKEAAERSGELFSFFQQIQAGAVQLQKTDASYQPNSWPANFPLDWARPKVWNILLLAFLDSAGFAERSSRQAPDVQFQGIVQRYAFVVAKLRDAMTALGLDISEGVALETDAKSLPLKDSSIDGVLFSPPYSFAVDYIENDASHLRLLGVDLDNLREKMIGLRGRTLRDKYAHYSYDIQKVLAECSRVLRPGRSCAIVIGTNTQQLAKLFGKPPNEVEGLDDLMIRLGDTVGLSFARRLERRIVGLANTMRNEDVLFFVKN
jgi:SAM-dependent methyltransferase